MKIILIPGTGELTPSYQTKSEQTTTGAAKVRWFEEKSDFREHFLLRLIKGLKPEDVLLFEWSTDNKFSERERWAVKLVRFIERNTKPDENVHIIAYSHGGNIVRRLTNQARSKRIHGRVKSIVTIGSPFLVEKTTPIYWLVNAIFLFAMASCVYLLYAALHGNVSRVVRALHPVEASILFGALFTLIYFSWFCAFDMWPRTRFGAKSGKRWSAISLRHNHDEAISLLRSCVFVRESLQFPSLLPAHIGLWLFTLLYIIVVGFAFSLEQPSLRLDIHLVRFVTEIATVPLVFWIVGAGANYLFRVLGNSMIKASIFGLDRWYVTVRDVRANLGGVDLIFGSADGQGPVQGDWGALPEAVAERIRIEAMDELQKAADDVRARLLNLTFIRHFLARQKGRGFWGATDDAPATQKEIQQIFDSASLIRAVRRVDTWGGIIHTSYFRSAVFNEFLIYCLWMMANIRSSNPQAYGDRPSQSVSGQVMELHEDRFKTNFDTFGRWFLDIIKADSGERLREIQRANSSI